MKRKILVVEDDAMLRDVFANLLEFDGYEIVSAADGAEGLELSENIQPEIVLLDVELPILDGLEVCRAIRKRAPQTRIVICTGRSSVADEIEGVSAGADIYLRKPFSPLELLEALGLGEKGAVNR